MSTNHTPPVGQSTRSSDSFDEALAARESPRRTRQRQLTGFWRTLRKEIRVGLVTLVAGAVLGTPVWIIGGMPDASDVLRKIRDSRDPAASGRNFTVLIADLVNDDAGLTQTQQLFESFEGHRGLTVIRTAHTIRLPNHGSLELGLESIRRTGEKLLREKNADVLVWGTVSGGTLQLRLLPRSGRPTSRAAYSASGDRVTLPRNFSQDLGTQLEVVALSLVAPATEQRDRYLVEILRPVHHKLHQLLHDSLTLAPEVQASLWCSYAMSSYVLGEQTGQLEYFVESANAYRVALRAYTPDQAPLEWARIEDNLGNSLAMIGAREVGTARLEEAVAAYRAALRVRSREQMPLAWASVQNNLGAALEAWGEREPGTARLADAVVAHRAALGVYTQELEPLDWARTQSNLGNALEALGEREVGTARLKEAVAAYHSALRVCSRERAPLVWAAIQNNLGNALQALGEREGGTARLEEAVAAHRAALQVYTPEHVPFDWATAQANFGNALTALGERESGTARLEEAVAAYRAALQVLSGKQVRLDSENTTTNLHRAERLLASRRR